MYNRKFKVYTLWELAEQEFEDARRDGLTVDQAQERAIAVLMEGVD